jgi:DNA-binding MarR family transcriptional regulator
VNEAIDKALATNAELTEVLCVVATRMARVQERALIAGGCEITYPQYHALFAIASGLNTITKIGSVAALTYSAISQTIHALLDGGYICQLNSSWDRREVILALTPKGERAMEHVRRELEALVARITAGLGDNEARILLSSLSSLKQNLYDVALELGLRPGARDLRGQG